MMLKLYGSPKSRAMRPLWLLQELGLEYQHIAAAPRSDEVRALSPLGKVPVLVDGQTAIADSSAIMTYLTDKTGRMTFPPGTHERAVQDSHMFFLLDEFDACLWTAARHSFILPKEHRVAGIKDSLKWEFSRSQKEFVRRLGDKPFIMGDEMTLPDIIAAHCGGWAITAKFEITEPVFQDYFTRLRERPAFLRASAG